MEAPFDYPAGGFLEQAVGGAFAGTTVTVDGAFEGTDPDGVKFNESMAAFEEATGIDVNYIGSKEFEGSIAIRVDAGDKPDIVDFPQPGLFANFVRSGDVVPVTDFISDEWLAQQYNPGWREFNTVDGGEYGVMHRYSGKSLVWYPKAAFEAAGYEVPETWDELLALTQTIADDGDTAWCIGIESGAATGWTATDWTEDMMLRTTSLENYDAWVAGELPFDSPEVKNRSRHGARSGSTTTMCWADGRRLCLPRSEMRRVRCSKTRRSVGCIVRPTSSPVSSRRGLSMAWTTTSSICRRWTRPTADRSWSPVTSSP
jgi:ABC-type glycerol-3-phosphate transport system substrate-binding protein